MRNGPYILIVPPADYPGKRYRDRYAYEHIVEFWKREGRLPKKGCVIHHKNENKHDNSWDNLEELSIGTHAAEHGIERGKNRPIVHGTLHAYQKRKCRCDLCRAANWESIKAYRAIHGRKKQVKIPLNPNGQGADC